MNADSLLPCAVISFALASSAMGQTTPTLPGGYPTKPMKILVGGTAGGGTDLIARQLAQKISQNWGRQMIVENHASALGSIIAMELTAKAPSDGYTLHLASSSAYMNAALVTKVPYDIRSAFAPIALLSLQPYVLVVNDKVPAGTVKELIAYVKNAKRTLNYGTSGTGTASHLGMELFRSLAGIDIQHIPYKGAGQAYTDLLGGRIELMFSSAISAIPQVRAGKVKAVGSGSLKRSKLLPDIPTIAESGIPGFELVGWYGLITTGGTPAPILAALNKESVQVMNSAEMQASLAADGAEPAEPHSPADFGKAINSEIDRWAGVIKASNLRFDN